MRIAEKPKSLPWLARRAGVPDHLIDSLWNKALALAGLCMSQAADPRRQAEAMQYLLLMLGQANGKPAGAAGRSAAPRAAVL